MLGHQQESPQRCCVSGLGCIPCRETSRAAILTDPLTDVGNRDQPAPDGSRRRIGPGFPHWRCRRDPADSRRMKKLPNDRFVRQSSHSDYPRHARPYRLTVAGLRGQIVHPSRYSRWTNLFSSGRFVTFRFFASHSTRMPSPARMARLPHKIVSVRRPA